MGRRKFLARILSTWVKVVEWQPRDLARKDVAGQADIAELERKYEDGTSGEQEIIMPSSLNRDDLPRGGSAAQQHGGLFRSTSSMMAGLYQPTTTSSSNAGAPLFAVADMFAQSVADRKMVERIALLMAVGNKTPDVVEGGSVMIDGSGLDSRAPVTPAAGTSKIDAERQRTVIAYFLNLLLKDPDLQTRCLARARLISALTRIASNTEIFTILKKKTEDIFYCWQHLMYVVAVDRLSTGHIDFPKFLEQNKEGLARSLWRSHQQDPAGVATICGLILDYNIYDARLFAQVLERCVQLRLYDFVRAALFHVHNGSWLGKVSNTDDLIGIFQRLLLDFPLEEAVGAVGIYVGGGRPRPPRRIA